MIVAVSEKDSTMSNLVNIIERAGKSFVWDTIDALLVTTYVRLITVVILQAHTIVAAKIPP